MKKRDVVGIVGLGFVGSAMMESFRKKGVIVFDYDKYKPCEYEMNELLEANMIFLCLPTTFDSKLKQYDKSAIISTLEILSDKNYPNAVICKSTVEPGTCQILSEKFPKLNIVHNPEFLTARTANEDYHNQKHIVLGKTKKCNNGAYNRAVDFHSKHYPWAQLTRCTSMESESAKIFANSFYAVKVQFFTELYLLCKKIGCDYDIAKKILIRNNWVNPMHTTVPGPDGEISYGGLCFPKDTKALLECMILNNTPHSILSACIDERDSMRSDHDNCN